MDFIFSGWVNSDRQMADGLTKPQAAWKLRKIVLGRDFPECKKAQGGRTVRKAKEILMGGRILDDNSAVSRLPSDRILCSTCYDDRILWKYRIDLETYPDMYHDTVSLAVSSRFPAFLCFCGCTRASFMLFGHSNTRVSPDVFISRFTVESVQSRNESIGRHLVSRVVQRTLGKYTSLSCWCRPGWEPGSFPLLTRLETWSSRVVYLDPSRGMKVNEFADLTSEFVSEYTEDKHNIVWSGRKHLETHECVDEPLDQVKSDSCFQSSDEGPSFVVFFFVV